MQSTNNSRKISFSIKHTALAALCGNRFHFIRQKRNPSPKQTFSGMENPELELHMKSTRTWSQTAYNPLKCDWCNEAQLRCGVVNYLCRCTIYSSLCVSSMHSLCIMYTTKFRSLHVMFHKFFAKMEKWIYKNCPEHLLYVALRVLSFKVNPIHNGWWFCKKKIAFQKWDLFLYFSPVLKF